MSEEENSLINQLKDQVVCPVEFALRILGGKWRGSILYQLRNGGLRFNELKYRVQDAVIDYEDSDNYLSNKVLSGHLKELQKFNLIERHENGSSNPVYQLTEHGVEIMPTLIELFYWGENLMRFPNGNLKSEMQSVNSG